MVDQAEKLRMLMRKNLFNKDKDNNPKDIQIYSIASGKGGVGKTNVVVNMAIALQRKGKNVLIIDADLGLANVDVILGIYPKYTLYDVLFHGRNLDDAIVRGPEGIRIIPGGSGMLEMASLDISKQEALSKEFLRLEEIDIILIDTGAGLSKNLLSFITFSQELILVTTPEPTALTDAYSLMKVLAQYGLKNRIKVILNRAPSQSHGKLTFERLEKTTSQFLNIKLENIGYVMEDVRVVHSVMNQSPFLIEYPNCLASKCIESIVEQLLEEKNVVYKIRTIQEVYNRLIKVFG